MARLEISGLEFCFVSLVETLTQRLSRHWHNTL